MEVSEKSRLEKLLGMLGSSFDGERANAARMIQAMAEKAGLTIAELIYGTSSRKKKQPWSGEKSSAPPPRQNPILKALHDISGDIEDLDSFSPSGNASSRPMSPSVTPMITS